jgi:hypothetical protein
LKLNNNIRIRLTPCGAWYQKVQLYIGGDHHVFWPYAGAGGQFSSFLHAVYNLYDDKTEKHGHGRIIPPNRGRQPESCYRSISYFSWNERGREERFRLIRRYQDQLRTVPDGPDPVEIEIFLPDKTCRYAVDGRELCYALAKAFTDSIKKYGIGGFCLGSGENYKFQEQLALNQLLFIKAYALGLPEVRNVEKLGAEPSGWKYGLATSLEEEIKLLLMDM